jgi:stage V sporulation protein G
MQILTKRAVSRMNVTDIRIRKVNTEGRMKAIVSVTFDNAFAVHDIKVVEGDKGLFVAMPSKRMPDGEYKDIAHPISSAAREMIQGVVLAEYEAALAMTEDRYAVNG